MNLDYVMGILLPYDTYMSWNISLNSYSLNMVLYCIPYTNNNYIL